MEIKNSKLYKDLILHNPFIGYALHKIITNAQGKAVDYEYIEVNHQFEYFTGLKKQLVTGKRLTELIPGIQKDRFNWIEFFGDIALNGNSKEIEQYSEHLKRWYNISAFSPEKGYFVVLFNDITKLKENELELKLINEEYGSLNEEYLSQNEELQSMLEEVSEHKTALEKSNQEINKNKDEIFKRQLFLKSILESTADGILVTMENGQIDYANQKFFDVWKIPPEIQKVSNYKDLLNYTIPQLSNPEQFLNKIDELKQSAKTDSGILFFTDGRVLERYSQPIIVNQKVVGSIWSFSDITEKQNQKNRLKDLNKILYGLKAINIIQSNINDRKKLIQEVCDVVVHTMKFSSAMINLFNNNKFVTGAQTGLGKSYSKFEKKLSEHQSFFCFNKNQGKEIFIIDTAEKACGECPLAGLYSNNSIYSIPIVYQNTAYGYFNVNIHAKYKDDQDFQQLFIDISNEVALSLHKIELEEKTKKYYNELKNREQSLRSIFRSSPVGIGVVKNRVFTELNQRFCDITGFKKEELIGESTIKIYPSEKEFELVGKEKYRQINESGIGSVETKFKCKNGEIIDVFLSSTPMDPDDWSKGVTFSALNITESKKNAKVKDVLLAINQESNLTNDIREFAQKTQQELSKIIDTHNFYIALYNTSNDSYTFAYHVDQYDDFDYAEKEYLLPNSLTDLVRRENKPFLVNSETEKELCKKKKIKFYGTDSSMWIGAPLSDSKGNAFGVIALQSYHNEFVYTAGDLEILNYVAQNLSRIFEKLQSENALQESEERFRLLIENQGEGVATVDLNEDFKFINPAGAEIFGLHMDKLVGKNLSEFMDDEQFKKVKEETLNRRKGKKTNYELNITNAKGLKKDILLTATPLFENKKVIGNLGIFRDITDYKKTEIYIKQKNEELQAAEEELRATNDELRWVNTELEKHIKDLKEAKEKAESADKLKSAFLANMSHEIRTPMNSILGFSELLRNNKLDAEKQTRFVDIINTNGKQLITIIDDIIDFSKIEANQIELRYNSVDVIQLLEDLFSNYQNKIQYENLDIRLELNKPEVNEFYINADETRLKQIITNLLSNAFKFTKQGKVEFGCQLNDKKLLFFVKDTGIGIAKEKQQIIFERFRQADDSLSRVFGGTGLGLSITKSLIELMKGEIWVDSEPEKGANFYFTIPID